MNRLTLAPFVVLLCCLLLIAVYGLPIDNKEWTDLDSIAGSRDQPQFPGTAEDSEAQALTIEIEPDNYQLDVRSDDETSTNNSTDLQTRFGFFNRPYPPFYGAGFVPPSFGYKPFVPQPSPPIPFDPFGAVPAFSGSNFASGLNSTGFFWNGAFYPFETTTTTTTSAPSSGGGNYYAFFFREGEASSTSTESSHQQYSHGTDLQSVQEAIAAAAAATAAGHGFAPFAG